MWAAEYGHADIVKLLLGYGVNPEQVHDGRDSAYHNVDDSLENHAEIKDMLRCAEEENLYKVDLSYFPISKQMDYDKEK